MDAKAQKQDWFYDNREYYNYVLLNASPDDYSNVQKALKSNKIKVLKAAASFRPASNGIQYKWYIRIEGENFKSPTSEQIKSIVEGVLISDSQSSPEQSHILLQERINLLTSKIDELQRKLEQKNTETVNVNRLSELEIKNLQSRLNTVTSDLEKSNQTINDLSQQIKNSFNLDDVAILEHQFKSQINNIESQLRNAKSDLAEFTSGFQDELNQRDIEIATLAQERDKYINELQNSQERLVIGEKDNSQSLFFSAIHALMPNVEFVRSSLEFAWNNFSNQEIENIFKALKMMDSPNMRAEKVEGSNGWKEHHSDRVDWRIYFRQCKDKQYQVLISDKDTQEKRDWDWLKNQRKNC